jgi:cobalt-zinc-cadmium efflux system membrane fusion protein
MKTHFFMAVLPLMFITVTGCGTGNRPSAAGRSESPPAPLPKEERADQQVRMDPAAQKEAGLSTVAVKERSVPLAIRSTGRITTNEIHTWKVGAITEGRIMRIYVSPGDHVKQGQVLARMHSHDIHEARALYRRSLADLARMQAAEAFALRLRDRMKRLYELKAASLEQVEHAENELSSAQTSTANARIEVQRTRLHLVEFLQIRADDPPRHVEGEQEPEEDLIPIKSPESGTLLVRNVTPGTVVVPSNELFVVTDLSSLWMIAAVNEENLSKLRVGMPASVYVQAYPEQPFSGKVARLSEELDATTRTIKVRIELPNKDGLLKPEMYATAEIAVGGSEPALFVPHEAVQVVSGAQAVFIRAGESRFALRPIQTGRNLESEVEVLRGLQPGETVVARGSFLLKSLLLKSSLGE